MKFLHLSDLHIGLSLLKHDLSEDQKYILDEIVRIAAEEKPDAVLVAGDIYDRSVPSAEAVEIFDDFVSKLSAAVPDTEIMIISGNHDNTSRLDIFRGILSRHRIHMIGKPPQKEDEFIEKATLSDEYGNVNFYLLPFVRPSMLREITGTKENGDNLSYNDALHRLIERENIDTSERNVLVSHQFYLPVGDNPDDTERSDNEWKSAGNIDVVYADVLEKFDYAALGHIHKPMKVGSEFYRYCGTPMAYSLDEAKQQKGIIRVETGAKGDVKTSVIPLVPLRKVSVIKGTLDEVTAQGCDDYVSVVLTDKADLDIFDMNDCLRRKFPNLLNITRENTTSANYDTEITHEKLLDPFELCCDFLNEDDEEKKAILRDVINTVMEGGTE